MLELRKFATCLGTYYSTIFDKNKNMSIDNAEWNYVSTGNTTLLIPAKFYVGIPLEKLHTEHFFSGVSTLDAGITANIIYPTAYGINISLNLVAVYDALIKIDVVNQQCYVQK
jgi:hypothetical protein